MLSKNLNLCFIKQPATIDQPPPLQQDPSSTATSTFSSSASLLKTFNSMYDATPNTTTNSNSNSNSNSTSKSLSLTSDELSVSDSESEPDFSTVFASTRFFFSSPGRSNSIVESSTSADSIIAGGVPVPTYSPDPFMDFRRSMQEMVDDRKLYNLTSDWNYLNELLLCYLALNPKHTHKYIFAAFADLLITLTAADKESQSRKSSSEEASSNGCTVE